MKLCSEHHDEVCYECRYCPACGIRDILEAEISNLRSTIEVLEEDIKCISKYT